MTTTTMARCERCGHEAPWNPDGTLPCDGEDIVPCACCGVRVCYHCGFAGPDGTERCWACRSADGGHRPPAPPAGRDAGGVAPTAGPDGEGTPWR